MADLSPQIEQAGSDPASVSVDGLTVAAKPVDQLIKADQYLAAKSAASGRRRGLRFSKVINPGTVSDGNTDVAGGGSFNTVGGY
ncbi:MAG: hypothetical protein K2P78_14500 [Gemmataceae bacterium]|nr:hypothetical protein [Gemmataceae bacterium]